MTKRELTALTELLDIVPDVEAWFEDSAAPRRLRTQWDEALRSLKIACGLPDSVVRSGKHGNG
jgi:hypothetical protein